jgi:uncharacterized protein YjdB/endonuclease I
MSFGLALGVGAAFAATSPRETNATVGNYTTDASTYYSGISSTATGNALGLALHNLMMTTHQTYTSYSDISNYTKYTDTDPNDSANIITIYAGASVTGAWDGNGTTWNREHVWCQSLSAGIWQTTGAGADFQHIRPSIPNLNFTRNNRRYADLNKTGTELQYNGSGTGNYYDSNDCFEPRDAVKGDIARILMYVYTHYSEEFGGQTNSYTGALPITNIFYTAAGTAQAAWNQLMDWNTDDPVDSFEMARNNQAAVYQGNRNPFIDHPEYANRIWGTAVTSFTMPTSLAVTIGGTGSAAGTVTGGTASSITYSVTSGSSYASVNSSTGAVTGLAAGSAVVTGSAVIGGTTYTDTTTVTVSTETVSSVTISPKPLTLTVGGTSTLTATVLPSSVSQGVTWSSSSTSIATVSSTGAVTAVAAGSATITATSTFDTTKSDTCTVTVNAAAASGEFQLCTSASDLVAGSDYVIGSASATSGYFMTTTPNTTTHYIPGESLTITNSQVTPSATTMIFTLGGSAGAYTFYSTNCTVSQGYLDGTDTTATYLAVTAATSAGTTQQWTITISSTGYSAAITCNGKTTRTALRWNSTSPRFSTYDTETSAIYNCYLYKRAAAVAVTSVTLSPTTLALKVGQTSTLTATISPTNATNKAVTWSSSNTAIATVANGVVTAVAAGSATITVTTSDGGHTATCTVTVTNVTTVLSISASNAPDLPFGSLTYNPASSSSYVVMAYWNNVAPTNVTNASTISYPNMSLLISNNKVLGLFSLTVSYTDSNSVTVTTTVNVRVTNVGASMGGQTTTTVTKTIANVATANSWVNGTAYTPWSLDANITISSVSGGNNAKYYSSNSSWRIYQTDSGTLTVTGASGVTLSSITVTFTAGSSGTLGSLTSGTATAVSGSSVTYFVGSSSGGKGNIQITAISVTYTIGASLFTYGEQANALMVYLNSFKTCEISDIQVARFALEYNAMKTDDGAATPAHVTPNSKTIFATLQTSAQYVYGTDYTAENGYTGGPSGSAISCYVKLLYIVKRYNSAHQSNPLYLYDGIAADGSGSVNDATTYEGTNSNGTGNHHAPVLLDAAGHIIDLNSKQSSLSTTLIVVASSGVFTLLMVAGIFLLSKKKKHA